MMYSNSYQALVFETMFKTIVKKTIKKNIKKYSASIQEEIDSENIFQSVFPDLDLNYLSFQRRLGEITNPQIVNGEYVKIIEPNKYWRYIVEYMIKESFNDRKDKNVLSFKEHYEDILIAVGNQASFLEKNKFLKDFYKPLFTYNSLNLSQIFIDGDLEQFSRINNQLMIRNNELKMIKELFKKNKYEDVLGVLQKIYREQFKELIFITKAISDSKMTINNKSINVNKEKINFHKDLLTKQLDGLLEETVNLIPNGLKEDYINKINVISHLEFAKERYFITKNLDNYLVDMQAIFNKYRENPIGYKLTPDVFEKLPSLNGIKYNKVQMEVNSLVANKVIVSILTEVINSIDMMLNDRIVFKSIRLKDTGNETNILFNFKEDIPVDLKLVLLNSFEDLILDYIMKKNQNQEWYEAPKEGVWVKGLNASFIQNFLDLNNETTLRLKIEKIEKEEPIIKKKKKI